MAIDLSAFEKGFSNAIEQFWKTRDYSKEAQKKRGKIDKGNRSSVTSGKNMDGFINLIKQTIVDNGLPSANIFINGRIELTLPGYYRPTKNWDLLVVKDKILIAAIELKSQVGPSFGNNFNNRVEEAIGNAVDLNTAFREGAFGESDKPFVGHFFLLEDCKESRSPVNSNSPHFPVFSEFIDSSYSKRYDIFCRKLVQEQLYDSAALIMAEENLSSHKCLSQLTDVRSFFIKLASKVSEVAIK